MDKKQMEKVIGHTIRNDTYWLIKRMIDGEDYADICKDLNKTKEFYGIKKTKIEEFTSEQTCKKYLKQLGFIYDERKRADLKDLYSDELLKTGVYGIFCGGELIYIGKTIQSFWIRFNKHRRKILQGAEDELVYKIVKQRRSNNTEVQIEIKPLIILEDLSTNSKITNRDIEAMELALIQLYQPIGNVQGRLQKYHFSK